MSILKILFNLAGTVICDRPTEILVLADTKSGHDTAKIFSSLPPEATKNYAYRFVMENNLGRSTLGTVTTVIFWYLKGACDT